MAIKIDIPEPPEGEQPATVDEFMDSVKRPEFAAKQEESMKSQRSAQMGDWELMASGEEGFRQVAESRGWLDGYETASKLVGGDSLRRKLTRDSFVKDVTGATLEEIETGAPQLQVAKGLFKLDDPSDDAFDAKFHEQVQGQITFRENATKLFDLSAKHALEGRPWADTVAEATKLVGDLSPYQDAFNQGRAEIFKTLRPEDVQDVNQLWSLTAWTEGTETQNTAGGNLSASLANYERMTPAQRDGVLQGIAMRAHAEGEDVDGTFNRMGEALRSGFTGIASGLASATGRADVERLKALAERGTVPFDTPEITVENALSTDVANRGARFPTLEDLTMANRNKTRPITEKEKAALTSSAEIGRGYARFLQDIKNAGIKAKDYRSKNTEGGWFFGGTLSDTLVNLAESVPTMAITAIPYAGPAMMATSYSEQARARIESQFPNADPDTITAQSVSEGLWMAGADIVQNKLFASKVPKLNAAMLKLGKPGGAVLFASRAATTGVLETVQEVGQDLGEPVIQSITAALNEDIKGPDWNNWINKEVDALGDIFRVSMLLGIVGGAGSTITDYMDGGRLKETLKDRDMLALNGIPPEQASEIATLAETNPAAAAQLLQAAQATTSPETRRSVAQQEARRQELENATNTLREAGIPEMSMRDDGKVVVQYNDGITNDRIFDTPEQAKQDMDSVMTSQMVDMGAVNRDLIAELEGRYQRKMGDVKITQEPITSTSLMQEIELGRTSLEMGRQRARIYLRNAKNQMGVTDISEDGQIDSILGKLMVQGSSRNEYAAGVTNMVLQIRDGSKPTVVFEEAIEGVGKWMLDKGGITREKMTGWIRQFETQSGEAVLAEDYASLPVDQQFTELIEGFSKIGVAHATGRIQDSSLPAQIKDFFRAIRQMISDVLKLAAKVREFTDSDMASPEFRYWLDVAAGFDTEGEIQNQRSAAEQEIASEISRMEGEGGPSYAITADQDAAYLQAVESGDLETAQRMVDDAAKAAGYTQQNYLHGSKEAFDAFDKGKIVDPVFEGGFFFTKNPDVAGFDEERTVRKFHLKFTNPKNYTLPKWQDASDRTADLQSQGFDAIVVTPPKSIRGKERIDEDGDRVLEDIETIIFEPEQAKSADPVTRDAEGNVIPLSGRFNPEKDSISYAVATDPIQAAIGRMGNTPEAKAKIYAAMKVVVADTRARWSKKAVTSNLRQRDFDQFRDMALLEAVARVLPGEVRGVLTSGFRTVAELRTTEARENYIASLLPRVEHALESSLQRNLRGQIGKLIKKGVTKVTDGRNREGRIETAHAAFDQAKEAMKWRDTQEKSALEKTEEQIEALTNQLATANNLPDAMMEELLFKLEATQLFGDWLNADSSRLTQALEFLQGKYDEGRAQRLETLKARRELKESRVQTVLKGLNREGEITESQRDEEVKQRDSLLKKLSEGFMQSFLKPHQIFARLAENAKNDPALGDVTRQMTLDLLNATNRQTDANFQDNAALKEAMLRLSGSKTDVGVSSWLMKLMDNKKRPPVERSSGFITEKASLPLNQIEAALNGELDALEAGGEKIHPAFAQMSDEDLVELEQAWEAWNLQPEEFRAGKRVLPFEVTRLKNDGERQQMRRMSQLQGLYLWLTMRQPDQAKKLERLGYDEQTFNQLDSWLSDDVKQLGLWMADYIDGDAFTVDAIHRNEKGIGIRFVTNYFPVRVERGGSDNGDLSLEGGQNVGGMSAGFIKQRVNNNTEPALVNAISVFLAHRAQVNFWKSHVTPLREWKSVISDDRFAKAVRNVYGETYYKTLSNALARIENNGRMNAAMALGWDKAVNKWIGNFAAGTLGLRLSTMLINLTASANFAMTIPANKLASGMARAIARPESFKEVLNHPEIQRRYRQGSDPVVQAAMSSGGSLGVNPFLTASSKLAQAGVMPIGWIDTTSQIAAAAAVYEYTRTTAIENGMSEEKAIQEANNAVDLAFLRSAQPVNPLAKSEFEQRIAESSAVAKFFGMFASDSFNKLAIMYLGAREAFTGTGTQGRALATQSLFVSTLAMGAMSYIIRSFYQALANPEDNEDEEFTKRYWSRLNDPKKWAYALMTEPFKSVPMIGEAFNQAMGKLLGQKTFAASRDPLGQNAFKLAYTVNDLVDDDPNSQEEAIEGGITLMQTIGTSIPGLAPLSQLGNAADAIEGMIGADGDSFVMDDKDRGKRIKSRLSARIKEIDVLYGKTTGPDGKINKEVQRKKWNATGDAIRLELQELNPEDQKKAIEQIHAANIPEGAIKAAGFEVPKK